MRRFPTLLAILIATLLLGGTAVAQSGGTPLVAADWLQQRLDDPRVVVLDIRPAADMASGNIPGAIGADFERAGWYVARPDGAAAALPEPNAVGALIGRLGIGNADHVVIAGKDFASSARVYWTFKVLGHDKVSVLDGGWQGWNSTARPVDLEPGARPATRFEVRYRPELRAELAQVAQVAGSASGVDTLLVDARPRSQWEGQSAPASVRVPGRLSGALSLDAAETTQADGRLKPRAELEQIFAGVTAAPRVILYCNTGLQSAAAWFVASEMLGHGGARLYDASLSQWAADPARPMVR